MASYEASTWPQFFRDGFHRTAQAFKIVLLGNTGSGYAEVATDANGHLQVDVLSGGGGGGTQYVEDDPAASGDTGTMALARRNDLAATTLTNTDGDYSAIAVDAQGRVITSSERQHNTASSAGDMGTQIMGVRNDDASTTLSTTNLNHSEVAVDLKGRLITTRAPSEAVCVQYDASASGLDATYDTALSSATWRYLKFVNTSDIDVRIEFGGSGGPHKKIPAATGEVMDLWALGLKITGTVGVAYDGTTATRGRIWVEGMSA